LFNDVLSCGEDGLEMDGLEMGRSPQRFALGILRAATLVLYTLKVFFTIATSFHPAGSLQNMAASVFRLTV